MVTPIETYYAGYRFRSRLEARWAVFFRSAGIDFQYEPEGFDLGPKHGLYLPDFYLPQFRAYVEIKPMGLGWEDESAAKVKLEKLFEDFREDADDNENKEGIVCIFCKGDPVECTPEIYCYDDKDGIFGWDWFPMEFVFALTYIGLGEDKKKRRYTKTHYMLRV